MMILSMMVRLIYRKLEIKMTNKKSGHSGLGHQRSAAQQLSGSEHRHNDFDAIPLSSTRCSAIDRK